MRSEGGTTYRKGGHIMTDTNGPGGPTMMAQLVRGDHLCRGTIYLVTGLIASARHRYRLGSGVPISRGSQCR